jgi:hypothetical protein
MLEQFNRNEFAELDLCKRRSLKTPLWPKQTNSPIINNAANLLSTFSNQGEPIDGHQNPQSVAAANKDFMYGHRSLREEFFHPAAERA